MTAALPSTHGPEAAGETAARRAGPRGLASLLAAAALLVALGVVQSHGQGKPRPALKESEARRAIAATPGFELRTGAVKIREVSPRGAAPVRVTAEVKLGVRFERVEEEEGGAQNGGLFKQRRWRAAQLRTGDRRWEEFDLLSSAAGAEAVEPARRALEALAAEFEERERAALERAKHTGDDAPAPEPLARGPLRLDSLSPLGSSAVGEVAVEAEFLLERVAGGRWRVAGFTVAGRPGGDLAAILRALDERKAARARADLEEVRAALERYRTERGRYAEAPDFAALMDHLNPLFIGRVVRVDPWHQPYLYAPAAAGFSLSSAGPDGRPGTADDVTVGTAR